MFLGVIGILLCCALMIFCESKRRKAAKDDFVIKVRAGVHPKPSLGQGPPAWRQYKDARDEGIAFAAVALVLVAIMVF